MTVFGRIVKIARGWRLMSSNKIVTPSLAPFSLYSRSTKHLIPTNDCKTWQAGLVADARSACFFIPAILAGMVGAGVIEASHAEADGTVDKPTLPSDGPTSYASLEETARKDRQKIEELLRSKGLKYGSYPRFTVAVKGQQVTIKFRVPPACDVSQLVANLVSQLGLKAEERGGSVMLLRAWDSSVAWQLTLSHPKVLGEAKCNQEESKDMHVQDDDLRVLIFHSHIGPDETEIEFIKRGSFSSGEVDAFVSVLQLAGGRLGQNKALDKRSREDTTSSPSADKSIASLESMGVRVYGTDEPSRVSSPNYEISWENIAGYDLQKREIEDTILLALQRPETYDDIARGTRRKFESNRPRAVLFEGPPGTGKTSCARVIANQAGVPLLYVPLEVVMSKYYGESERLLGKVFSLANELPNGAIIFLDEVDSFAVARDSEMHEATRRILSVILRQIDGFEQDKKVVVVAATNRKQDLDPALISRFDSLITFGLPDKQNREEIAAQYAKHLTKSELEEFSTVTEEMSGRDIRDVCQQAERSWASKIIRGVASKDGENGALPPLQQYMESAINRRKALLTVEQNPQDTKPRTKKAQLA